MRFEGEGWVVKHDGSLHMTAYPNLPKVWVEEEAARKYWRDKYGLEATLVPCCIVIDVEEAQ